MSRYILILIWFVICAFFAERVSVKKVELVHGVRVERYCSFFALCAFLPVIIMAGTRSYFGDTWAYRHTYLNIIPETFPEVLEYVFVDVTKDRGFYLFSGIIKIFIGDQVDLYFWIITVIQGCILIAIFRKYSISYLFSAFLFVASTDYISWMFNGLRQFTAVVIVFAATTLIIERKFLPLIAVILLASTMHATALMMIPIVFIVQGEAWNKKTLCFIFAALLAIFFVGSFTSFLDSALADTQYKNVVSDYTEWEDDGTNPIRVLIYSIPAIISFFGRKQIKQSNSVVVNICTNMSIVSAGLYVVSMFTSGIFIGRLPIYCSLYSYILLPWEIENIFDGKVKLYVYLGLVSGYLIFYYYQMHMIWGLI